MNRYRLVVRPKATAVDAAIEAVKSSMTPDMMQLVTVIMMVVPWSIDSPEEIDEIVAETGRGD